MTDAVFNATDASSPVRTTCDWWRHFLFNGFAATDAPNRSFPISCPLSKSNLTQHSMKKTHFASFHTTLLIVSLAMFTVAGCEPGSDNTNVAADADQEAIDDYNRLIQEEADRVKNSAEQKNI